MVSMTRIFEGVICMAFYAGICYLLLDGAVRQTRQSPLHKAPPQKVMIVSAAHDYHCKYQKGDYLNLLSAINKQDYARLHNYNVLTPCSLADPTLTSMWNKIGWLLKAMKENEEEWYLWVDIDTVIIDVTFTLPFERFHGKDFITWGNSTRILAGDPLNGMNSGVMLFRKSEWSLKFLSAIADLGRIPEPRLGEMMREQLTDPDYKYDTGLRDQNAIVYLLKKHWPEMRTKLQLVNKQYCLNCYWRDLMAIGDIKSSEKRVQFVNHFSGCQMCLDLNKNGDMPECEREYIKSFEYANSVMMKLLARKPPRNLTMHDSLLASFFCQEHPEARECRDSANAIERAAMQGQNLDGRKAMRELRTAPL